MVSRRCRNIPRDKYEAIYDNYTLCKTETFVDLSPINLLINLFYTGVKVIANSVATTNFLL